jgi:hypothetical protein
MTLSGFEDWLPYKKNLLDVNINTYKTPFQGDLVKLNNTTKDSYELLISGCCDIAYQEKKLDFLTFVGVMPVSLFLKKVYIQKKTKEQLDSIKQNKNDTFATPKSYSLDSINKDDFDKYIASNKNVKKYLKTYFENNNIRSLLSGKKST